MDTESGRGEVTGLNVRQVQPAEWAALRSVRLAALAGVPEAFASTLAHEVALDEAEWRQRAANFPTFIAWRAGEPVGLVSALLRQEGDAGENSRPEWGLASMWVSPDVRGTGCADLLVSAAVEAVRAKSAECLTLWVADSNARARAFYLRAGFRPTGIRQVFRRHDGVAFGEEKFAMCLGPAVSCSSAGQ